MIDNEKGVHAENTLEIPFLLHLKKGRLSVASGKSMIIAQAADIVVDSASEVSYIDGKVTKLGLQSGYFLFPVGKSGRLRWLSLSAVTGDISAEYYRESAYEAGGVIGTGLDHISATEYWKVEGSELPGFQAELSFGNEASGGVSDLGTLRVAAYNGAQWTDAGNSITSGNAFRGTIRSLPLTGLVTDPFYLTLASSIATTNLLPLWLDKQWMVKRGGEWRVYWIVSNLSNIERFDLEYAADGKSYHHVSTVQAKTDQESYSEIIPPGYLYGFCRIRIVYTGGGTETTQVMKFGREELHNDWIVLHSPGDKWIMVRTGREQDVGFYLSDCYGRKVGQQKTRLAAGLHQYSLRSFPLRPGIYFLTVINSKGKSTITPLIF